MQVELGAMPMQQIVELLQHTSLFLGYHGAAFDNIVFLPRGATVLEILPKGSEHAPLYPAIAHRTGKEFAR
jgi:capsular polysaccharide biosynthesis protein